MVLCCLIILFVKPGIKMCVIENVRIDQNRTTPNRTEILRGHPLRMRTLTFRRLAKLPHCQQERSVVPSSDAFV